MKNLFLVLALVVFSQINAQDETRDNRISFGIYQDLRLAVLEDDAGNKPFTTDVRLEFMMEGNAGEIGSGLLGGTFEYADLSEFSFTRYGVQGGYNFRNMPFFDIADYQLSLLGGVGVIMRGESNRSFLSFELTAEFAYFVTDWMSINAKLTMMQRGDLEARYNDPSGSFRPWDWKPNGGVGIKFYIYN